MRGVQCVGFYVGVCCVFLIKLSKEQKPYPPRFSGFNLVF